MKQLREIILAIESFRNDIVNYPIFFKQIDLEYLNTEEALKNISEKISQADYQPEYLIKYSIPYDLISTREAYHISIDDLIIKYFITNQFKKEIDLFTNHINPENFKIYCVVDIYNCYQQIQYETFLDIIKAELSNDTSKFYLDLLEKSLKLNSYYSDEINGFIIGSKPDEYLVELFLSLLHSKLTNDITENISRNGDEFLICANSLSEIRNLVERIQSFFKEYKLEINRSKNFIKINSENRKITRVIPYEEPWPYSSPSCPPPMYPTIHYKEVNYTTTYRHSTKKNDLNTIDSYESSIEYLKSITPEIENIENLVKKYSPYSLFGYWNSSTPTYEKKLHEAINFERILNPIVLDNLETIIYRYPRSQYFSAIAIKNICIYAKNMNYTHTNSCKKNESNAFVIESNDFSNYNDKNSSLLCEKSNSILLNAIRSAEIYDYQKYLIIRELYFDKKKMSISKENYKTNGQIPFPILFENEFIQLNENNLELELPLQNILNELLGK